MEHRVNLLIYAMVSLAEAFANLLLWPLGKSVAWTFNYIVWRTKRSLKA